MISVRCGAGNEFAGAEIFLRQIYAFIVKDIKIAVSYKLQFMFQFLQVFFGVAVIYFIGKVVDGRVFERYGGSYFEFALVGIAVSSYCKAGFVNITNGMRQLMSQGVLESLAMSPVSRFRLMYCCSGWEFVFETVKILFYFFAGAVFFGAEFENANWGAGIFLIILTAGVFLLLGVISCSILVVLKRGDPVNWFFSSLAALLGGAMFPVDVLPGWLRVVSWSMPLTHSLEGVRRALLVGDGFLELKFHLAVLLFYFVLLVPIAKFLNRYCMDRAMRSGAFSTY